MNDLIELCKRAGYKPGDAWLTADPNYTIISMLQDNPGLIEVMEDWIHENFNIEEVDDD